MSTTEMKQKAINVIEKIESEEILKEILDYLDKKNVSSSTLNLSQYFDEITEQYDGLMKRLA